MRTKTKQQMPCEVMLRIQRSKEEASVFKKIDMKDSSVVVESKRGEMEFKFDSILDRNSKDKAAMESQMGKLVEYYKLGGNISVITYGQKGIGKSSFLWSEGNGFAINVVNKIISECPQNTDFEFAAVRVTNECVRINFSQYTVWKLIF